MDGWLGDWLIVEKSQRRSGGEEIVEVGEAGFSTTQLAKYASCFGRNDDFVRR